VTFEKNVLNLTARYPGSIFRSAAKISWREL